MAATPDPWHKTTNVRHKAPPGKIRVVLHNADGTVAVETDCDSIEEAKRLARPKLGLGVWIDAEFYNEYGNIVDTMRLTTNDPP